MPAVADPEPPGVAGQRARFAGRRALVIANSPFEGPALAARLAEAGAEIARADGLEAGLAALAAEPAPDIVIVDCALGREATHALAVAARAAGAAKSLVLFSPFERRAFGGHAVAGFDGWLVKPVRARSLYERLAEQFPQSRWPSASAAAKPAARATKARARWWRRTTTSISSSRRRRCAGSASTSRGRATGWRRCAWPTTAARGKAQAFDLVLMDIKMPGLDGRQAVREIREIERETGTPPVAVVALTANGAAHDQRAALGGGGDEYLVKPFDPPKLAEAIERALAAARRAGGGAALVIIPFVSHAEEARERGPSTWVIWSCSRARAIWR